MLKITEVFTRGPRKSGGKFIPLMNRPGRYIDNAMYQTLLNKFKGSKKLLKLLLSTGDKYIVEAADYDNKFGIRLSQFSSGESRGCKLPNGEFDVALGPVAAAAAKIMVTNIYLFTF